jgi:signal transduction histidine kinase
VHPSGYPGFDSELKISHMVKDHNGYINVESAEGKGTTFTLNFPVTRREIEADQKI